MRCLFPGNRLKAIALYVVVFTFEVWFFVFHLKKRRDCQVWDIYNLNRNSRNSQNINYKTQKFTIKIF